MMANVTEIYSDLLKKISNNSLNSNDIHTSIDISLDRLLPLANDAQEKNKEIIPPLLKLIIANSDVGNKYHLEKLYTVFNKLILENCIEIDSIEYYLLWTLDGLKCHNNTTSQLLRLLNSFLKVNKKPVPFHIVKEIFSKNCVVQNGTSQENEEHSIHEILLNCADFINNVDDLLSLLMLKLESSEIILNALRTLNNLLDENLDLLTSKNAEQALSVAWHYMAYDPTSVQNVPFELHPASLTIPMQVGNKKNAVDKKKLVTCKSVGGLMNSTQLPNRGDPQWNSSRFVQSYIRYSAICLLISVIKKIDSSVSFRYWSYLIFPGSPSLRHCIRNDTSWCVRLAALIALEELISQSQPFLVHAESPRTAITSFTTFSETLGVTLMKLHDDFIMLLGNSSATIVAQTLRCLSTLVQSTPYDRVSNDLVIKVTENVRVGLDHCDQTICLETLTVIHSVLNTHPPVNDFTPCAKWIYSAVLEYLYTLDSTNVLIFIKSLQVIGSLSFGYFDILVRNLKEICVVLVKSLSNTSVEVRLQAGRTIEEIGDAMKIYLSSEDNKKVETVNECVTFWQTLISPLISLLQDEQHISLRVIGCDCVGNIDAETFQALPRKSQILVITALFSCVHDVEAGVRGAAIRATARGILEAGRQDDPGLVADVAQKCIVAMRDSTPSVRVKAAWALANVGDALLLNRNEESCEDLPNSLYLDLFNVSLIGAQDNDKVKCNVTRAIGNFLRLVTRQQVQNDNFKVIIEKAILALVKNASTGRDMKTKWNSCYALGNMLKNGNIYGLNRIWEGVVFPELIKLAMECKNFKVRTNAVLALSAPLKRWHYSTYWVTIWSSLMQVLDSSQHIDDFKEYKHRDTLVEQVCLTLAHLASVADHDDLVSASVLILHEDNLKSQVLHCYERLIPERAKTFLSAVTNITMLMESGKLGEKQKHVANKIKYVFSEQSVNEIDDHF